MTGESQFEGFPKECVKFFAGLATNNEKSWFEAHREQYEQAVLGPSRLFVSDMGERLRMIAPGIHADPRVNKSLFRIFRDIRFSKSKAPYKTHLGIWFWEGDKKRMECSGFYFHLEPKLMMLGVGMHIFPNSFLGTYRKAVADDKIGAKLVKAIEEVANAGDYAIGGEHYKRVPRGFDKDHKRADLLKHNGLWAGIETKIPKELHTAELLDLCFEQYRDMAPLHKWLVEVNS